jgi:cysteine-rich secretory family protein
MGRRKGGVLLAATVLAALLVPAAARATHSQEAEFVSDINAERTSRGLSPLFIRDDLIEVARAWSARMASEGRIWHDPNITEKVQGWTVLGDNVGRGPSASAIHRAFMESPTHKDVILDPRFNEVGVGIVMDGSTMYVTEILARRASSPAPFVVPRRYAPAPRPVAPPQTGVVRVALIEQIWGLDIAGPSMTVDVLVRLVALDSLRVDPATGAPR